MTIPVSLTALRSFVEVGRHGSIKQAAQRLGVTPGAISQQIKLLELRLGAQLLERRNREVRLSVEGRRLFDKVASGFEQIEMAFDLFGGRRPRQEIVISTTPSFAACWLTSRLGSFAAMHPDIEVRIETSAQLVDLGRDPVDVAIRHGTGTYPGLDAARLFAPALVAVGSRSLLADGPLASPADCLRFPLLQDRDRADWSIWLDAHGVKPSRIAAKGPSYADDALLIQGAMAGQGLAVVRDVYAKDALAAGKIMLAVDAPVLTSAEYFVVVRPDRMKVRKIAAFRKWIMHEAKASH